MKSIIDKPAASKELLVAEVTDRFIEEVQQGLSPSIDAYAEAHPEIAGIIRQVFPALALLDKTGTNSEPPGNENGAVTGQLGDFRILHELGRGGMGVVYEAEQISIGRRVALKVLPFAAMLDRAQLNRFKNEARAAGTLDHPHIVSVLTVGMERGVHYYAMQLVEGQSLAEVIAERRGDRGRGTGNGEDATVEFPAQASSSQPHLPSNADTCPVAALTTVPESNTQEYFRTVAALGIQAAEALDHAHQNGIVHRDVKPGNLLVDAEGKLYVTDFGLARIEADAGMTMTGDLLGTLRYMSPEQALAKRVVIDHRTDVYSLGATLYELLTLQPAYHGSDRQELLKQIAFEDPQKLRQHNSRIPVDLETIVAKAMEKNPSDRYETSLALADDLQRFLCDEPIRSKPPTFLKRVAKWSRRHIEMVYTTMAALLTLAIVSFAAVAWVSHSRSEAIQQRGVAEEAARIAEAQKQLADQQRDLTLRSLYLADSRLAHRDWLDGDFESYDALLRSHTPEGQEQDFRGWEWYYLRSLSMHEVASLEGMFPAYWSPNGAKFAYVGGEHYNTIVVKDATNWSTSASLIGHEKTVKSCAWSPDGKYLASLAKRGALRVWDIETGECQLVVNKEFSQHVMLVAWSPDGSKIAVTGVPAADDAGDSTSPAKVLIYDPISGEELQRIPTKGGFLWSISWSPDGTHMVAGTASSDSSFLILNVKTGAIEREIHEGFKSGKPVFDVAWSKDGRLIAATNDGDVHVWNTDTWTKRWMAQAHRGLASGVAWAPDSNTLASVGYDGLVKIWSDSGALLNTLRGHWSQIEYIGWHPDGKRIASGSVDGTIKIWEAFVNNDVHTLSADGVAEWLPDKARTLGLMLKNEQGDLWSLRRASGDHWNIAEQVDVEIPAPTSGARGFDCISWSPDASRFALLQASDSNPAVGVFDTRSGKSLGSTNSEWSSWVAWHPSKNTVALGSYTGAVIWDWKNQQQLVSVNGVRGSVSGVWSPDGALLAMCSEKQELIVFHTDTWQIGFQIELTGIWHGSGTSQVAWSGDGKFLAAGSSRGEVYVLDTSNWQQHLRWKAETGAINSVAISPKNRRIATGGDNGLVKIWDFSNGKQLLLLDHHLGRIDRLSWSPDGTCLLAKEGTTYHIWDASPALEGEARRELQSEK